MYWSFQDFPGLAISDRRRRICGCPREVTEGSSFSALYLSNGWFREGWLREARQWRDNSMQRFKRKKSNSTKKIHNTTFLCYFCSIKATFTIFLYDHNLRTIFFFNSMELPHPSHALNTFLNDLKRQLEKGTILFIGNLKNKSALADLEVTPQERKIILQNLKPENYAQGPLPDSERKQHTYWVFGAIHNGKEIYIKITRKDSATDAICISFHRAEFPMNYPLKKQ